MTVVALAAGLAGVALAQDRPVPQGPGQAGERPVGSYAGVVPGSANLPPRSPAPQEGRLLVTWPGFQQRPDGASRFFLQTTGPVQVEQRPDEGRFVLILKDAELHLRNNRRPLETRYFNTPVEAARIERRGRDLAFVLDLRAPVTPAVSQKRASTGYNFVFLEFPAGNYIPEELRRERTEGPAAAGAPARTEGDTTEITVY